MNTTQNQVIIEPISNNGIVYSTLNQNIEQQQPNFEPNYQPVPYEAYEGQQNMQHSIEIQPTQTNEGKPTKSTIKTDKPVTTDTPLDVQYINAMKNSNCCFCINLRIGIFILCAWIIIWSILNGMSYTTYWPGVWIIVVFGLIAGICGIYGARNYREKYVRVTELWCILKCLLSIFFIVIGIYPYIVVIVIDCYSVWVCHQFCTSVINVKTRNGLLKINILLVII